MKQLNVSNALMGIICVLLSIIVIWVGNALVGVTVLSCDGSWVGSTWLCDSGVFLFSHPAILSFILVGAVAWYCSYDLFTE